MYQPVVVGSGVGAWNFLKATKARQVENFAQSAQVTRSLKNFREALPEIETAEQLVNDRRALEVALGAFGLQEDINNKFFIKKVIEEGVEDRAALANRLTDNRYRDLATAFNYLTPSGATVENADVENIENKFIRSQFAVAVGEVSNPMRLALNFENSMSELAAGTLSNDGKWFRVMGSPPLRKVMETALGLPSNIGNLDIDTQLEMFKDKASSRFGSSDINDLASPEGTNSIIERFAVLDQLNSSTFQRAQSNVALALLSGGSFGQPFQPPQLLETLYPSR